MTLIICCSSAFAQGPTLTFANTGFSPGDTYNTFSADTTGLQPGPAGQGQTWNFSNLIIGNAIYQNCVDPATTPNASSFPNATMAITDSTGNYGYFKENMTEQTFLGLVNSIQTIVCSNPETVLTYPFSYNDVINDTMMANYSFVGTNVIRKGTSHTTADGWGTLQLPSGNYSNVLRVKFVESYKDTCLLFTIKYDQTTYYWFDGSNKEPLLTLVFLTVNSSGTPTSSKSASVADFTVGIHQNSQPFGSIDLYPNPATGFVDIAINSFKDNDCEVSLLDMNGRKVMKTIHSSVSGNDHFSLDISGVKPGIYMVRIVSGNEIANKKLIVY